jgi:photosystem II stability/assembly factor-like uncharacterized protein/ABC-type transporter Mla MlaB component
VAAGSPETIAFAIRGPVARTDLPGLTDRICKLLARSGGGVALCDVRGVEPDAVTVDALARLQLGASRHGCKVRLVNASEELLDLVAFMGLDAVLSGRPMTSGSPQRLTSAKHGGEGMSQVLLLVGTRKGCFILESDSDRRSWELRGPYCESWPVYHVVHDADSGTIYAAAGSEWHGSAIWRSADLGATWEHSSEGLNYGDDGGLKLSKVSNVTAAHGRLLVGGEGAGLFESRDDGKTFSLISTLEGQPGRDDWNDPAKQPPGHLGLSAIIPTPDGPDRFFVIVQGYSLFETTDGGQTWAPRNKGLRADWPRDYEEIGFCCHKVVIAPSDASRMYQQNHVGMHRSDDAGLSWTEITEGLPTEFGFAAAVHPHDRDTFYVVPLDPGHARCMPDGKAAVWRTRDAGSTWQRLDRGLPQEGAHVGVLREGMAIDSLDVPGLYFGTSTGQVFASADEGDSWTEIASYLPGVSSVEVAVAG